MSKTHGSTTHHNRHHGSMRKKLKDTQEKLMDTPPYYDIYFTRHGFERILFQTGEDIRVANYYDRKHKYDSSQNKGDSDANVDVEAQDFIESRHRRFELAKQC
ncbi:hypothetical protein L6452_12893 [Arctium lappa]|uniref:Uncharacterized protein n=1 Tax=Arctium lappa TaxID=4217 RepID=A0ACB9CGQ9_ARCLA|nr:hypothetical protein L6452_12893 [Arctium lappa]